MHEMRIATAIVDSVSGFSREPGERVIRIGLTIGDLAGADPASLRFCFDEIAAARGFEGVELSFNRAPRRNHCPACDITFPASGFEFGCPSCCSTLTEPVGGDEIIVSWVDLLAEEDEERAQAAAAG